MVFDVLTLFPELISNYLDTSMLLKAQEKELISYETHDIRKHAIDDYGHVDDTLYGGGSGMLMRPEPIYVAYKEAKSKNISNSISIYMSPKGEALTQDLAKELANYEQIILLCGHYEGVDQRVVSEVIDKEVSIGDYVISSGELASLVLIDTVSRMLPGFLADKEAMTDESHFNKRLEARQYTKPRSWHGKAVPEVLLSGHHAKIKDFKYLDGLNETLEKRPDIFEELDLDKETIERLLEYRQKLRFDKPQA